MALAQRRSVVPGVFARVGRALLVVCLTLGAVGQAQAYTRYSPNNKIRVDISLNWGGAITGIRLPEGAGWGANLISDNNWGEDLQVQLYEWPVSEWWAGEHVWSVCQGGGEGVGAPTTPAWITGSGVGPDYNWVSTACYPMNWYWYAGTARDVRLDQWVYVYDDHIQINYRISGRPGYVGTHPTMFQEAPVVYGNASEVPGEAADRLDHAWLYDEALPWTANSTLTAVPYPEDGLIHYVQVFPTEGWIGMYRADGKGLTLISPNSTRGYPFVHHWSVGQIDPTQNTLRTRPYFDVCPGSGQTISWVTYIVPGTRDEGRAAAYALVPHDNWQFNLDGITEGWVEEHQLANLRQEGGYLKATSLGSDPYMSSLDYLDFPSDTVWELVVRMKVTGGSYGQVFYQTEEDPTWTAGKSSPGFALHPGVFYTYHVRLDTIAGWAGKTIKKLRLDPTDTGSVGIEINYMYLRRRSWWNFDSAGNNEGWLPVTGQWHSPAYPPTVTGGTLRLTSLGTTTDPYNSEKIIYPTLFSPYPLSAPPPSGPGIRIAQVRMWVSGAGRYSARLRYTLTSDLAAKMFEYHPDGSSPDTLETQFDIAAHPASVVCCIPRGTWVQIGFALPQSGTIKQLELVPVDLPEEEGPVDVEIDSIRIVVI